jgi:hypothetical protein
MKIKSNPNRQPSASTSAVAFRPFHLQLRSVDSFGILSQLILLLRVAQPYASIGGEII